MPATRSAADTRAFKITDDEQVSATVAEVREEFMRNKPFDRLNATILIHDGKGTWRRGSYNGETVSYPASCVKLPYMAAAMQWCRENNLPYTHLDAAVRPMIEVSDNVQTGVVVDAITSTTNDDTMTTSDSRFMEWYEKRLYAEKFLESRGLLENQTILHKTYPTNSGEMPTGAEKVAREFRGMNLMQPKCSASLMLEIVKGKIEPGATAYMMELLKHERWKSGSYFGPGLPPGSTTYNKTGRAYDTLEDIAYCVLPNGREFILAVFTNAYREPYSKDGRYAGMVLSPFAEALVERLALDEGCPPKVVMDNDSPQFERKGTWSLDESTTDSFGPSCMYAVGGKEKAEASWQLSVPENGLYEVCVWYSQGADRATSAPFTLHHDGGTTTVLVDQKKVGGRWFKLGDFDLQQGTGKLVLTNEGVAAGERVTADAVKAAKWPQESAKNTNSRNHRGDKAASRENP